MLHVKIKMARAGCSQCSLSADALNSCVFSGWNTQGLCKAAAVVQRSHSSGVSKQTLEHILRLWVYISHFFLDGFHSAVVVQRSKSPCVMCLHMLIAPELLAIQINKITTLWEKCCYFIVISQKQWKIRHKENIFFFQWLQWDCDRARDWVQVSWVPAQTFKHQNILLLVNSECFGRSFPRVFHN